MAISLFLICIVLLTGVIYFRQKVNKQSIRFLESEKENLRLEKELAVERQEHLQNKALSTSIQLQYKNNFISELKEKIQKEKDFNLSVLLKNEELIDNDFNSILNISKEVHPKFFKTLNEVSKNKLTNLDMKYAFYIYMNMDNTQISALLNVDPKTVSVTKFRLKQKIGLDKNQDLNNFIQNLNV